MTILLVHRHELLMMHASMQVPLYQLCWIFESSQLLGDKYFVTISGVKNLTVVYPWFVDSLSILDQVFWIHGFRVKVRECAHSHLLSESMGSKELHIICECNIKWRAKTCSKSYSICHIYNFISRNSQNYFKQLETTNLLD